MMDVTSLSESSHQTLISFKMFQKQLKNPVYFLNNI